MSCASIDQSYDVPLLAGPAGLWDSLVARRRAHVESAHQPRLVVLRASRLQERPL